MASESGSTDPEVYEANDGVCDTDDLFGLPDELIEKILSYLSYNELAETRIVRFPLSVLPAGRIQFI